MSDIVQYEKRGRIGIITLNRPEARNAVNGDVASGVEAAVDQVEVGAWSFSKQTAHSSSDESTTF